MSDDPRSVSTPTPERPLPHSRACGIHPHPHGSACHANCPTCHGHSPAPSVPDPQTPQDGAALIAAERLRQVSDEGWTPVHDGEHGDGALALAAAAYVLHAAGNRPAPDSAGTARAYLGRPSPTLAESLWPWDASWWKPGDPERDLVRAGALIAAEIDRIRRAATSTTGGPR